MPEIISTQLCNRFPSVFEPLYDDLNSAKMLAALWDILKNDDVLEKDKLLLLTAIDPILGLSLSKSDIAQTFDIPIDVVELVERRNQARGQKNWALSDELRTRINEKGFIVEDSIHGTNTIRRACSADDLPKNTG